MRRIAPLAVILAFAAPAAAQAPAGPGEVPLEVKVGERASLCPCPVRALICDDPSLVKLVEDASGQFLEGLKEGSTVCSVTTPTAARRIFRVTVKPRKAGG